MFGRKRIKPIDLKSLEELRGLIAEGRPLLLDFLQPGCRNCKIMDGIVSELAEEYGDSARVVKVDVTRVTAAVKQGVRSDFLVPCHRRAVGQDGEGPQLAVGARGGGGADLHEILQDGAIRPEFLGKYCFHSPQLEARAPQRGS